ncbi:MAG: DUF429 domain-containing protein [Actinobacteria bacterium]|nr:DUF429 domain-containing protein [Actinomycetota bacterium]
MRYIGVDLAWGEKGTSGLAVLDEVGRLLANDLRSSLDGIVDFIIERAGDECLVGIDAPLVVKNETSCRPCERALLRRGITLYPANRARLAGSDGSVKGEVLVERLISKGFKFTDEHPNGLTGGRFIYEVYPRSVLHYHCYDRKTGKSAAPRYKPRPGLGADDLKRGLIEVRDLLESRLELPLHFDHTELSHPVSNDDIHGYKGGTLKAVGDLFDAILSAYMVYWAHAFGSMGGEIVGDIDNGYVLVPPNIVNRG